MNRLQDSLIVRSLVLMALALWTVKPAASHEVRPALLQITERPNNHYDIVWKQPSQGAVQLHLVPHISGGLLDGASSSVVSESSFQAHYWRNLSAGQQGLQGRVLRIEGLDQTITDVLVLITLSNGDSIQKILVPKYPQMTFNLHKTGVSVPAYVSLGIEHILTGVDHLSFILGLILLLRRLTTLIKTITAFTIAHSITLAATTLHVITARPALIEALVALSVFFVAIELVRQYRCTSCLTVRYPRLIAFTFGLLHGSAFAGALAETGLPSNAIPLSLLLFNIGVELGQIVFLAAMLGVSWALAQWSRLLPAWMRWVPPYLIGSLSAFWFVARLSTALGEIDH